MTRRRLAAAVVVATAVFAGCGTSGAGRGDASPDATPGDASTGSDASAGDAATEASADASVDAGSADGATAGDAGNPDGTAPADAGNASDAGDASDAGNEGNADAEGDANDLGDGYVAPPVGVQLVQGDSLSVRGVTADGYLLYSDDALLEAYVMPFAGGPPQDLGALGSKFWNDEHGDDVFLWSDVTGSGTGVGTLTVWSSATGLHTIATASFGILSSASASSAEILYLDNVDAAGTTGDIYVSAADGSAKTKLVSQVSIATCFPSLGFAGSYAIVSYCPAGSSGNFPATLAAFESPSWSAGVEIAATSGSSWADAAGTEILYATAGGVSVVPLAGGSPTLIDATGTAGFLSGDGLSALYVTTSDAFERSPIASPSPTTLVSSGFAAWDGLSNDGLELLYYSTYTANGTDLYVTSTTTAGASATISATADVGIPGDPFTADSTHALYASGSTLEAYSIAGATSAVLGTDPFQVSAATAAEVVFDADFVSTGGLRFGRANLYAVDTSQSTAPARVASDVDAVFVLSPAGDQIAYSWSATPGSNAGIWLTPVP